MMNLKFAVAVAFPPLNTKYPVLSGEYSGCLKPFSAAGGKFNSHSGVQESSGTRKCGFHFART